MISGALIGEQVVIARLRAMPEAIKAEVDRTVMRLGFELQRRVQTNYLRGPRPARLGVVTGRLLRSITQGGSDSRSRFLSTADKAIYYVGTNVEYAAGWEYGFTRKVGAGARGGPRTLTGKSLESYIRKHPPGTKQVGARPFLAPALSDMSQQIVEELTAALRGAAEKTLRGGA